MAKYVRLDGLDETGGSDGSGDGTEFAEVREGFFFRILAEIAFVIGALSIAWGCSV